MGHRDNRKPGELSVRLGFGHSLDAGPSTVVPHLDITDETSGMTLQIRLTPEQLTEMLAGGTAEVDADRIVGFAHLHRWGKYLKVMTKHVKTQTGDFNKKPFDLPHVAAVVEEIEDAGYLVGTPHRNNAGQWVITGRRYDAQP